LCRTIVDTTSQFLQTEEAYPGIELEKKTMEGDNNVMEKIVEHALDQLGITLSKFLLTTSDECLFDQVAGITLI
jgi:hypothetical protein